MSPEIKFLLFQVLIIAPFAAGYFIKPHLNNRALFSKRLIRFNLIVLDPLVVLWSIWGLSLYGDLVFLPLAGLCIVLVGFLLGRAALPFMKLTEKGGKTFLISASLANHGFTMGGFICYLFGGEQGLALAAIFVSYFMPYVFIFIFPYARAKDPAPGTAFESFKKMFIGLQNMPLYAVIAALGLHLLGIARPRIYFPLDALIMASVSLYYFSLGTNFNPRDILSVKKEQAAMAVIKFLALPAAVFVLLLFFDLGAQVKRVILVQSFMPAAIYSVITAVLFDLDVEMASGLFVVNTLIFIIVILPVLFLMRGYLAI